MNKHRYPWWGYIKHIIRAYPVQRPGDLSGGRGSLKSSCVSLLVPLLLIANPGTHAVVLRKVANTIRDSVYAQYIWAIGELGMADTMLRRAIEDLHFVMAGGDACKVCALKCTFGTGDCKPVWKGEEAEE